MVVFLHYIFRKNPNFKHSIKGVCTLSCLWRLLSGCPEDASVPGPGADALPWLGFIETHLPFAWANHGLVPTSAGRERAGPLQTGGFWRKPFTPQPLALEGHFLFLGCFILRTVPACSLRGRHHCGCSIPTGPLPHRWHPQAGHHWNRLCTHNVCLRSMSTCPAPSPSGRARQPWQGTRRTISSRPS